MRERLADIEGAGDAADRVRISTIHGLCGRLLREHAAAAGVDPDFRVLAEGEAGILASEAFGRALRAYADEERADALDCWPPTAPTGSGGGCSRRCTRACAPTACR